jgi:predicted nuclease of predicted toxin-antitoxin system
VRFLLDHDVDAAVGRMLRRHGHECLTASQVGLATATDDALMVWACEHRAVVVSTDREFSRWRMKNAIGHHVWLRCLDWEADAVPGAPLADVASRLEARSDLTIRVSADGLTDSSAWSDTGPVQDP